MRNDVALTHLCAVQCLVATIDEDFFLSDGTDASRDLKEAKLHEVSYSL